VRRLLNKHWQQENLKRQQKQQQQQQRNTKMEQEDFEYQQVSDTVDRLTHKVYFFPRYSQ